MAAPCSSPGNETDDDERDVEDGEDDAHYKERNLRLLDESEGLRHSAYEGVGDVMLAKCIFIFGHGLHWGGGA